MTGDEPTSLRTPRLLLRPWAPADAPALMAAFGSAEAMRFWNAPPAGDAAELAAAIAHSRATSPDLHAAWAVLPLVADGGAEDAGPAVGMVNYHHRDAANGRFEVGFVLAPVHSGRGYAAEALGAVLGHGFGALGAHRAEAFVAPGNARSVRLLERLGFRAEGGPLRDRLRASDGGWMSVVAYGLLAEEWRGGGALP